MALHIHVHSSALAKKTKDASLTSNQIRLLKKVIGGQSINMANRASKILRASTLTPEDLVWVQNLEKETFYEGARSMKDNGNS